MKRPCLLLDRDGVLVEDMGYLRRVEDIRPIPGSFAAVARARVAGFPVVVVTNQSGIGRGYYTEEIYRQVQIAIETEMLESGAALDAVYFCPSAEDDHPDRKPNPGMLLRAALEHQLDLANSIMIGDKLRDLEAGVRAGVGWVCLVLTGEGAKDEPAVRAADLRPAKSWVCRDLAEAVERWLEIPPRVRA